MLTYAQTGNLLPGLFGFRVFSGHWSLTNDRPAKKALLAEAGIVFAPRRSEPVSPRMLSALQTLVGQVRPERIVLRADAPAAAVPRTQVRVLHDGPQWIFLQGH